MPTLDAHQSNSFVKLCLIGDSGTGKTGALVSLVAAGYKFKYIDLDNGLDSLKNFALRECPDNLVNVDFETVRDKYKMTAAGPLCTNPKAFVKASQLLTTWSDGSDPAELGPEYILVIDSGSALGKAAFEWARGMNPGAKEPRTWYFSAQQAIENIIAMLTGDDFHCNFIFITHISYQQMIEGSTKGQPSSIGQALGSILPRYFNTMLSMETKGTGADAERMINTMPTNMLDLKNPVPFNLPDQVPIATGMATIFDILKGGAPKATSKKK